MRAKLVGVGIRVSAALGLVAAGCASEAMDQTISTTGEAVTRYPASTTDSTTYGYSYLWSTNGSTRVQFPGLPANQTTTVGCGLTIVGGKYTHAGDKARVTALSTGVWAAWGESGGGDPGLDAMCFALGTSQLGDENYWAGTTSTTPMILKKANNVDAGPNDTCFLTGLQGDFSLNYGVDAIRIQLVNNKWQIDGGPGRKAWARCVNIPRHGDEGKWVLGNTAVHMPAGNLYANVTQSASGDDFCGLTRIHGALQGGWAGTYLNHLDVDPPGTFNYYLAGGKNTLPIFPPPIGASSQCFNY